jgi:hypothetical protein
MGLDPVAAMKTYRKLKTQFQALKAPPKQDGVWAVLDDSNGTVDAGDGLVYARLPNGLVIKVYNGKIAAVAGQTVKLGFDHDDPGFMQILSVWKVHNKTGAGSQNIVNHRASHTWPAYDAPDITVEQFTWLRCMPIGDFVIQIQGGVVQRNGVNITVDNQIIDIAANVPATGARYVLIQSDNTGIISAKNGAAVGSVELLANTDIPAVDSDCFPLCAVRVYDSQVELQRGTNGVDDFFDLRFSGLVSTGGDIQIDASGFNGNLDPSIDTVQELAQAVDDLATSGAPVTTAENDFQVGGVGGTAGTWVKKTLAQVKTILGLGSAAYIDDAASDNVYYGRRNAGWTNLETYFDTRYSTLTNMSAANATDLTDGGATTLHTHAGAGIPSDGWIAITLGSPTRTAATTFTTTTDLTALWQKGYKLKFTDTSTKYAYVIGLSAYSAGSMTVTIAGDALVGNPSAFSYSGIENPLSFPFSFSYTATFSRSGTPFTNPPTLNSASY